MKVLGVSGSPIPNSNTDRALKVVLEATGTDTEFIKLLDYDITPCTACLDCVETNVCSFDDDGNAIVEKAKEADALVVAGYTPYSMIDSRTKIFLERLYPLRHKHGYMAGKPGAAVITSAVPADLDNEMIPPACEMGVNAIMFYMMEEGMNFLGAVKILGNVPCIKCGNGDTCKMSAIKMMSGPEATVDSVGINTFEKQPLSFDAARELGEKIGEALKAQ